MKTNFGSRSRRYRVRFCYFIRNVLVGLTAVFVLYTGAAILFCGNSEWWGWRDISFCFSREVLEPWPGIICFVLLFPVVLMATAVAWALLSRRQRLAFLRRQWTWPKLKPWLLFAGILLGWVALFYLEENWRGQRAWNQYRHELEAAGEHLDFASLIPPPVSDDQNFAMAPVWAACNQTFKSSPHLAEGESYSPAATKPADPLHMPITRTGALFPKPRTHLEMADRPLFPPGGIVQNQATTNVLTKVTDAGSDYRPPLLGNWMEGKLTDLKAWQFYYRLPQDTNTTELAHTNEFPVAAAAQSPAADVLLAMSKYGGPLDELRQASERPHSRFPINYETNNPLAMRFPHYARLKECSSALQMRAVAELNNHENSKALADVKLILYLSGSIQNEPLEWATTVRREIVAMSLQPIWEGLALRLWSDDQLAELDQALARYDALTEYQWGLRGERALALREIEYFRTERMANGFGDMGEGTMWILTLAYRCSPDGWLYGNEQRMAQAFMGQLPTEAEIHQHIISPKMVKRYSLASGRLMGGYNFPGNFLVWDFFPYQDYKMSPWAKIQASVDMARIACALERYRQAHGNYPVMLDVLAPEYMAAIPHDIINGQPLHYRRTTDGQFVLYSVGWNEKDDGGVPTTKPEFSHSSSGDWVWQYPAVQSSTDGD